jgi:RNA-directed DNA polymerase
VISPLLANIALHGMEEALGVRYWNRKTKSHTSEIARQSVGLVRYADDFLVFCHTQEQAEEARQKLTVWLKERGLTFSEEKTRITTLDEGFDFLGFNVRQYPVSNSKSGYRLLMRPSNKAMKEHARKLKQLFRECRGRSADDLCKAINPVIRGWANYFRVGVSARSFEKLDSYLYKLQWRWARWQHPNKSAKWRRKRYWGQVLAHPGSDWTFKGQSAHMRCHAWTPIKRHIMVQRWASWDDPDREGYWAERKKHEAINFLTSFQKKIAERQKWVCPTCGDWILNGEEWHEHRIIPGSQGGKYTQDNILLVHLYCHQAEHSGDKRPKESE